MQLVTVFSNRPEFDAATIKSVLKCRDRNKIVVALERQRRFDEEAAVLNQWFTDQASNADLNGLRNAIETKGGSVLGKLTPTFRAARDSLQRITFGELPSNTSEWINRLDKLIAALAEHEIVVSEQPFLLESLGTVMENPGVDINRVKQLANWVTDAEEIVGESKVAEIADIRLSPRDCESIADAIRNVAEQVSDSLLEIGSTLEVDPQGMFDFPFWIMRHYRKLPKGSGKLRRHPKNMKIGAN